MNENVSSSCNHENDYISRQVAIREYQEVCKGIKCGECPFLIKVNTEKGSHLITDCKLEAFLHDLPSVQPEPCEDAAKSEDKKKLSWLGKRCEDCGNKKCKEFGELPKGYDCALWQAERREDEEV